MDNKKVKEFIKHKINRYKIIEGFRRFKKENGHYPSVPEIDECDYLPSSRWFQRKFGGVIKFRELVGIKQKDQRDQNFKKNFNKNRIYKKRQQFYQFLVDKYGKQNVDRPWLISDDKRLNISFKVTNPEDEEDIAGIFVVYSKRIQNLNHCFSIHNYKFKLLKDQFVGDQSKLKLYFVSLCEEHTQERLDKMIKNKKTDLDCTKLYSIHEFKTVNIFD